MESRLNTHTARSSHSLISAATMSQGLGRLEGTGHVLPMKRWGWGGNNQHTSSPLPPLQSRGNLATENLSFSLSLIDSF